MALESMSLEEMESSAYEQEKLNRACLENIDSWAFEHKEALTKGLAQANPDDPKTWPLDACADYANALKKEAEDLFGPQKDVRETKPHIIREYLQSILNSGSNVLVMRHTEQHYEASDNKKTGIWKKVEQMQSHENMVNGQATSKGMLESVQMHAVFMMLGDLWKKKTGGNVHIQTTPNPRGKTPADLIARATNTSARDTQALACIDYKNDQDLGLADPQDRAAFEAFYEKAKQDAQTTDKIVLKDAILAQLNQSPEYNSLPEEKKLAIAYLTSHEGKMPWIKEAVDAICGENSFDTLIQNTSDLRKKLSKNEKDLKIILSHTQQLNLLGVEGRASELATFVLHMASYNLMTDGSTPETKDITDQMNKNLEQENLIRPHFTTSQELSPFA